MSYRVPRFFTCMNRIGDPYYISEICIGSKLYYLLWDTGSFNFNPTIILEDITNEIELTEISSKEFCEQIYNHYKYVLEELDRDITYKTTFEENKI